MHNKSIYFVFMGSVFVCMSLTVGQSMASIGRLSARAIQESKQRILCLNSLDLRAYAEDRLHQVVPLEKKRDLLDHICHLWLSTQFIRDDRMISYHPRVREFMMKWSKKHSAVADWTSLDIKNHMSSLVLPGQTDRAMTFLQYCRTQMAMQCDKCQSFGRVFLGMSMPEELSVFACEAIDDASELWLQSAALRTYVSDQERQEYQQNCRFALESSRDFEVQMGRDMTHSKKNDSRSF